MLDWINFFIAYHVLGHAAAISMFYSTLTGQEMMFCVIATNLVLLLIVTAVLSFVKYPNKRRQRLVKKLCQVTENEVEVIEESADSIIKRFHDSFGHLGYYISIAVIGFLSFFMGAILAYVLKVNRRFAWPVLMTASAFTFAFWYFSVSQSVNFIDHNLLAILTVGLTVAFLAYGHIREKKTMHKAHKLHKNGLRRKKATKA